MKRLRFIKPKKVDYLNNLTVLRKGRDSAEYHQLIEASASAYFETRGITQ